MASPQQRFSTDMGRVALFVANEAQGMNASALASVARQARSIGVDTLCVKRAEGTGRWYNSPGQIAEEYKAVTEAGCGYVPFTYMYGPRFGSNQVTGECQILTELTDAIASARGGEGFVIADMELEWNNQPWAAAQMREWMINKPGLLGVTTWADPDQQGWDQVVRELLPVVNSWIPQAYNNWLSNAVAEGQNLGELNIEPAIDLSQEFGANDQIAIAQTAKARGESTIWLWEYTLTGSQRQLVQNLAGLMKR